MGTLGQKKEDNHAKRSGWRLGQERLTKTMIAGVCKNRYCKKKKKRWYKNNSLGSWKEKKDFSCWENDKLKDIMLRGTLNYFI